MRPVALFFLLLLVVSGFFACSHDGESGKVFFRYNEADNITSLDPAFARNRMNLWGINLLFNGLVQVDDQLRVQPCIAERWDVSPDGKTYTFHLRKDVRFHDSSFFSEGKGRKVVAADFVYSFGRILDKEVASTGTWLISSYIKSPQNFEAPNDSTFVIRLDQTCPLLLNILTVQYFCVVPKEVVEHYGKDFGQNPVGTGAFRFLKWQIDQQIILVKNNHYFERTASGEQMPFIDGVKITFTADRRNEYLQFEQGKLDALFDIHPTYKDDLLLANGQLQPTWEKRIQLLRTPQLLTEYLGIQTNDSLQIHLALKKREVRQAISYAIDRKKMLTYLRNNIGYAAHAGFVPNGMPSFDSMRVQGCSYNPKKASQLLTKAGYPNGKGINPIVIETVATYKEMCLSIQKQLAEVGIPTEIEVNAAPAMLTKKRNSGQAMLFTGSWLADFPDAENYLACFYSPNGAPPNYTRFNNYQYDCIYRQALQENDSTKRYDLYKRAENLLVEEMPLVPIYYGEVLRFVSNKVQHLGNNPQNLLNLKQVKILP
ncbi:MAG: ABC transporter substrate-binding protein [Chitinophagales bacterium]|nr:ABC transporter substrate-binding protein [Chitinophagales bacterium]